MKMYVLTLVGYILTTGSAAPASDLGAVKNCIMTVTAAMGISGNQSLKLVGRSSRGTECNLYAYTQDNGGTFQLEVHDSGADIQSRLEVSDRFLWNIRTCSTSGTFLTASWLSLYKDGWHEIDDNDLKLSASGGHISRIQVKQKETKVGDQPRATFIDCSF